MLEACLARGRLEAARWLLDQGVAVHQDSLQIGAAHLDAVLAERLLRLGAISDPNTVLLALQYGDADAARIMARPLLEESPARANALRLALASRAERERSDARRVRSGKMGSNRSPDDYLVLAERLERFLAELPG